MKDYVASFQKKIAKINADAQKINIINAGITNHGKSSLFNSLLDRIVFLEEDIRTTVKIQIEQWRDDVYLIDTPGLEARTTDDDIAYEAYRRANVILFVHKVTTGELREKDIVGINKIKSLFPDEKFFTEHFCLVLTSIDDQKVRNALDTIRNKTVDDIKRFCGLSGFKIFYVSNTRYRKGMTENKQVLVSKSGIPELREYLQQNFSKWRAENKRVRNERITRDKENFLPELWRERANIQSQIQDKTKQIQRRQESFLNKVAVAVAQYREDESRYQFESNRLEEMRRELKNLQNRWNNEHY